jgi:hypothetical protein
MKPHIYREGDYWVVRVAQLDFAFTCFTDLLAWNYWRR